MFSFVYGQKVPERLNKIINNSSISADSLYKSIRNFQDYTQVANKGKFIEMVNMINDTLKAPYFVYIPESYNPNKPTPLMLELHGGGFDMRNATANADSITQRADFWVYDKNKEFIHLYPLGSQAAIWWTEIGINNILKQIRILKESYNIDDNRIYVGGFSAGGAGSFSFAMNKPNDFAAFCPMNGSPADVSIFSDKSVYPANLANRAVYAIGTDIDPLFPNQQLPKTMQVLVQAGANLTYNEISGIGHEPLYYPTEMPKIYNFFNTHPRDPFNPKLVWQRAYTQFSECDWLKITSIDTLQTPQSWQQDYQTILTDNSMALGFFPDMAYTGKGVKVSSANAQKTGISPALKAGLSAQDIVVGMDGKKIDNLQDLSKIKATKKLGDKFSLTILRNKKKMELRGEFPLVREFSAFYYPNKSGILKASFFANTFTVEGSCVKEFAIKISPEMVQMNNPVKVFYNGTLVYNQKCDLDRSYLISDYRNNLDRKALWVNEIEIKVK